jgi:pyruvate kinase
MEQSSLYLEVLRVTEDGVSAQCRAVTGALLEGLITVSKAVTPAKDLFQVSDAAAPPEEAHGRGASLPPPPSCLCEEDLTMIGAFEGKDVDFLALSYTETAGHVEAARKALDAARLRECGILAKVETLVGLQNFAAILDAADGLIISRGNLGLVLPIQKVARLQKEMVRRCNAAGKPVFITRIFDSMTDAPRPTRAEATDVANAVLDGVDGFLLGAETVRGKWPIEVVEHVRAIAAMSERVFHHDRFFDARMEAVQAMQSAPSRSAGVSDASARRSGTPPDGHQPGGPAWGLGLRASLASTLVRVAEKAGATLIVVFTKSGRHAQEVAVWRPRVPILALFPPTLRTTDGVRWVLGGRCEARRAMLLRGVIPLLADPKDGLNDDVMLVSALQYAQTAGLVTDKDTVAVSHRLRDDIVISVVHVCDVVPQECGACPPYGLSPGKSSAAGYETDSDSDGDEGEGKGPGRGVFDRTPSAYDLQRHKQHQQQRKA